MAAQQTPEKAVVGDKHIIVPTDLPSGLGGWESWAQLLSSRASCSRRCPVWSEQPCTLCFLVPWPLGSNWA